jgi:hypothetical protein
MAETTLLALALAVQDAHGRLATSADGLPEEARFVIVEVKRRLEILVTEMRNREQQLDELHDALADRMNNLLMAIKTASDLLRGEDNDAASHVRERLDSSVENGRQSVKRLRDSLTNLR